MLRNAKIEDTSSMLLVFKKISINNDANKGMHAKKYIIIHLKYLINKFSKKIPDKIQITNQ